MEDYVTQLMSIRYKLADLLRGERYGTIRYEPMVVMVLETSGIQMRADTIHAKILQD